MTPALVNGLPRRRFRERGAMMVEASLFGLLIVPMFPLLHFLYAGFATRISVDATARRGAWVMSMNAAHNGGCTDNDPPKLNLQGASYLPSVGGAVTGGAEAQNTAGHPQGGAADEGGPFSSGDISGATSDVSTLSSSRPKGLIDKIFAKLGLKSASQDVFGAPVTPFNFGPATPRTRTVTAQAKVLCNEEVIPGSPISASVTEAIDIGKDIITNN